MALPISGPISMNQINIELGSTAATQISLNDTIVRTLLERPTGDISLFNGYGKPAFSFTLKGGTNVNLNVQATLAGWNGVSRVIATIPSGNILQSSSTSVPALSISGSFPQGVTLINNGSITGCGGAGGAGPDYNRAVAGGPGNTGSAGGTALYTTVPLSITNNGTIAGGGGGGGSMGGPQLAGGNWYYTYGGAGGGGGAGRGAGVGGQKSPYSDAGSQSGAAGTATAGGLGGLSSNGAWRAGNGGALGQAGTAGAAQIINVLPGGGGGGAAGYCTSGNAMVTWLATGTRLGLLG